VAYFFNGTTQYLTGNAASVTATPLTIACWFYSSSTTTPQRLVGVINPTTWARWDINLRGQAGATVGASAFTGSTINSAATTTSYTANTWSHACGVFTSDSSRTAYLNAAGTGSTAVNASVTGVSAIRVGVVQDSNGLSQYLAGRIAEVGIWSAELTVAEINSLARGVSCDKVRPQSLRFYAPLTRELIDVRSGIALTNINSATTGDHLRMYS